MVDKRMSQQEFIDSLRERVKEATDGHLGKIIDITHNNEAYYEIESIINFCIDYFLKEGR